MSLRPFQPVRPRLSLPDYRVLKDYHHFLQSELAERPEGTLPHLEIREAIRVLEEGVGRRLAEKLFHSGPTNHSGPPLWRPWNPQEGEKTVSLSDSVETIPQPKAGLMLASGSKGNGGALIPRPIHSLRDLPKVADALLPQIYEQIESSEELKDYILRYGDLLKRLNDSIGSREQSGEPFLVAREIADLLFKEGSSAMPLYRNPLVYLVCAALKAHCEAIGDLKGYRIYDDLHTICLTLRVANRKRNEEGVIYGDDLERAESFIRQNLDELDSPHPWLILVGQCAAQMQKDEEKQKFYEGLQKERERIEQSLMDLSKRERIVKDVLRDVRKGWQEAAWKLWNVFEIVEAVVHPVASFIGGIAPTIANVRKWVHRILEGSKEAKKAHQELSERQRGMLLQISLFFEDYRGAVLLSDKGSPLRIQWEGLVREAAGRPWLEKVRLHPIPLPPPDAVERVDLLYELSHRLVGGSLVAIEGKAGAGKTTLAAQLARSSTRPVFWYPFRDKPNVKEFLINLAHFIEVQDPFSAAGLLTEVQLLANDPGVEIGSILPLVTPPLARLRALLILTKVEFVFESEEGKKVLTEIFLKGVKGAPHVDMVTVTQPSDSGEAWLDEMGGERLTLARMSEEEAKLLLKRIGVSPQLPESEFHKTYQLFEGHPQALALYGESMVRREDPRSAIVKKPDTLVALFRAVYGQLKPAEKILLNYLSVFREPVSRDAIQFLVGSQIHKVEKRIKWLKEASIVEERSPGVYEIHESFRGSAYEPIEDRARYHRKVAKYYRQKVRRAGASLEAAHHSFEAGDHDDAIRSIEGRAEDLFKRGYGEREWEFLKRFEGKLGSIELEERSRAVFFCELGTSAFLRRESVQAQAFVRKGLEIADAMESAEEIEGRKLRAFLHNRLGEIFLVLQKNDEALEAHKRALALQEKEPPDRKGMADTLHKMGRLLLARGNAVRAQELYELSYSNSKDIDDWEGMARTCHSLGKLFHREKKWEEAKIRYHEGLEIYNELGDLQGEADILRSTAEVHFRRRDWESAENDYKESLRLYKKLGDRYGVAATLTRLGELERDRNNKDRAREYLENAVAIYRALEAQELIKTEETLRKLQPLPLPEKIDEPSGDDHH